MTHKSHELAELRHFDAVIVQKSPFVVWWNPISPANRRPLLIYGISSCQGSVSKKNIFFIIKEELLNEELNV